MRSLNKLLALFLALTFSLFCLSACDQLDIEGIIGGDVGEGNGGENEQTPDDENNTGGENGENEGNTGGDNNSEGEIDDGKYLMNVEIRFATGDDKMKPAIDVLDSSSSVITVDGENIKIETLTALDSSSIKDSYVFVDGVLYRETVVSALGLTAAEYKKADAPDLTRDKLYSDIGTAAQIGISDFLTRDMSKTANGYSYSCSDISDSAKESLVNIFGSKFSGVNEASVTLEGAEYILETEGNRNTLSTLYCHFVITMNGESYEITMHILSEYDYSSGAAVTHPEDSDKYTEVDYSDVIG